MKKAGFIMIVITIILLFILKGLPSQFRYFIGAFGIVGGIVLVGVSKYSNLDSKDK